MRPHHATAAAPALGHRAPSAALPGSQPTRTTDRNLRISEASQPPTAASQQTRPRARSDDQSRDMQFAIIQVDVNSVLYHSYACQQSCRCYRRSVHVGRSAMRSIDMSITRFFRSDKHGQFIAAYKCKNSIGTLGVIFCSCCNVCDAPFGPTHLLQAHPTFLVDQGQPR